MYQITVRYCSCEAGIRRLSCLTTISINNPLELSIIKPNNYTILVSKFRKVYKEKQFPLITALTSILYSNGIIPTNVYTWTRF